VGNLLSNAIKYTPDGGQIGMVLSKADEAGFLKLSVTDTGVGISDEDHRKLCARFFRGASAAVTGAEGAGMGLYITRSLVELHGGRIWLKSVPEKGTTFCVTFPVADERAGGAASAAGGHE
jgi:signal transduction histidine kinase